MTKMVRYTFEELEQFLANEKAQLGAAEMHGLLVGVICGMGNIKDKKTAWLEILIEELSYSGDMEALQQLLNNLVNLILFQLRDPQFSFELTLPSDETELCKRSIALADWCRGFLCGLGLIGVSNKELQSNLAKEAIMDLSQIVYVATEQENTESDIEADENAFLELTEYVRIAVQTIHMELQELQTALGDTTGNITIH